MRPSRLHCPWNSPGKRTGVGCHSLLQGIFPTEESNSDLLHCGQILYCQSHQGSPALSICLFYLIKTRLKITIIIEALCKDINQKFTNTHTSSPLMPRQDCREQTLSSVLWHHTRYRGSFQKVCEHHTVASLAGRSSQPHWCFHLWHWVTGEGAGGLQMGSGL